MVCTYDCCPAKVEIDRLISGHKDLASSKKMYDEKFHRIEIHHSELLNLHTKLSGEVAVLGANLTMQQQDREEKHKATMGGIEKLEKNLINHTEDEMRKFNSIQETFEKVNNSFNDVKLSNNLISWKVIAIFSAVSTGLGVVGTYIMGTIK